MVECIAWAPESAAEYICEGSEQKKSTGPFLASGSRDKVGILKLYAIAESYGKLIDV